MNLIGRLPAPVLEPPTMEHDREEAIAAVLGFWFGESPEAPESIDRNMKRWFGSSASVDAEIRGRFEDLVEAASRGGLEAWCETAHGRLALIVLLDQFRRNLYRRTAAAFARDPEALRICLTGLEAGCDAPLAPLERGFFYMPMQHAESLEVQNRGVRAFEALAETPAPPHLARCLRGFAESARDHQAIIERFGRFPHRNEVLGRPSTPAELEYLEGAGARFGQ